MSAHIDARLAAHRRSKHVERLENAVKIKVAARDALFELEFIAEMPSVFDSDLIRRRARRATVPLRAALKGVV